MKTSRRFTFLERRNGGAASAPRRCVVASPPTFFVKFFPIPVRIGQSADNKAYAER